MPDLLRATNKLTHMQMVSLITDRDGYLCYLCSRGFSSVSPPTLDHVIPLAKGGTWDLENLKLAHKRCNVEKGDRLLNEDGTLDPKPRRVSYRQRKVNKQEILNSYCAECEGGRLLFEEETCDVCGGGPGPRGAPRYLKRRPKDCDHSIYWCWLCAIGIEDRTPVMVNLLTGE